VLTQVSSSPKTRAKSFQTTRRAGRVLWGTVRGFFNDGAFRLAAALSYYALLSLAPLVLVTFAVVGLIVGRDTVDQQLLHEMRNLVGEDGAEVAKTILEHADRPQAGITAIVLGTLMLFFGATGVFGELQDVFHTIWRDHMTRREGVWGFFIKRLVSLLMITGVIALLLGSLMLDATLTTMQNYFPQYLREDADWLQHVYLLISTALMTLLFAMMFKFLPNVRVRWFPVWISAMVTAALFVLGRYGIGLYLGYSGVGSLYGAAGSLVALLVWVYYSSLILFFGVEFTREYSREFDERFRPGKKPPLST
jgi:membrane protein